MEELKQCPFCGHKPKPSEFTIMAWGEKGYQPICCRCHSGNVCFFFKYENAVKAWNTRTEPTPPEQPQPKEK